MAEKHMLDCSSSADFEGSNSDQKRIKLEEQQIVQVSGPQGKVQGSGDPHNTPPSRVVHARAVPDGCTHQQMVATLTKFGKISYITMMPRMRQALVEFENVDDAISCVQMCQSNQIYIMDRPVFFNFSTSQEITRSPYGISPNNTAPVAMPLDGNHEGSNHILLCTVFNPMYPITVEVIRTICSPYGFVQRVVVFRKNGLQVLVEYDSIPSAQRAKSQLDGADIYAGCCTLKIEYAKTTKLNVYKNDEMTWDYTPQGRMLQQNFRGGSGLGGGGLAGGGLAGGGLAGGGLAGGGLAGGGLAGGLGGGGGGAAPPLQPLQQPVRGYQPNFSGGAPPTASYPNVVGTPAISGSGSVIMIYGLTPGKHNCDHVFNLLCSYGNVLKVKVLQNKPGTAMAHMDSPTGAKNAIHHLHGRKLLGETMELNYSRHTYIADYSQGGTLIDGSPCWKDFSQSRNNRFMTVEGTSKNRIISPGKVLHFYNSPPDSSIESLKEVFTKVGVLCPMGIKFFSQGVGTKSATGLMEWGEPEGAMDAFVMANHQTIYSGSGQAYTFKTAFSNNTSLDNDVGQ